MNIAGHTTSSVITSVLFILPVVALFISCRNERYAGQKNSAPTGRQLTDSNDNAKMKDQTVILLHGLGRTANSMLKIEQSLFIQGYHVVNLNYPSIALSIEEIAQTILDPVISRLAGRKIHFVTHSMGGIVLRQYLTNHKSINLGRTVMLAPPNRGSEIVDQLEDYALFKNILGPAGQQLGTGPTSVPNTLGPAEYELGIITGNKAVNPFLSQMIAAPNDGKVSVESAQLKGMGDFLVVPYDHTYIMQQDDVIEQVRHFLVNGTFNSQQRKASKFRNTGA